MCSLQHALLGYYTQTNKDEMGGTYSMHEEDEQGVIRKPEGNKLLE